ncbi:MAG: hypothetical protein NC082_07710 [Clostridiales bacterium]|nr:hypothetical protein [Clostridiales bacterium]
MGHWIDWKNPKTFTEKIQWLKLYDRKPEYTRMVDKAAVKEYVANIIGDKYIIPTLGIWDNYDDIDFDALPNKFVLKTTHGGGSGGVVICNDKFGFDHIVARTKITQSLHSNIYDRYREWPYKYVPRRVIAEKYLDIPDKKDLKDYKFFCFNGKPQFLKVDFDRFIDHHANYYDMKWNLLPFGEADLPPVESHIELCPPNFSEMVDLATNLSTGHKFLRVDLYNIAGKIYFGELTFYPASGMGHFTPNSADSEISRFLNIK